MARPARLELAVSFDAALEERCFLQLSYGRITKIVYYHLINDCQQQILNFFDDTEIFNYEENVETLISRLNSIQIAYTINQRTQAVDENRDTVGARIISEGVTRT